MAISKKVREQVFYKCNGRCAYCGEPLQNGWHVDHVKPIRRVTEFCHEKMKIVNTGECSNPENETINNYMPACASCNINKHQMTLEQFRGLIKDFINSLNKTSTQYKIAKRYGLLVETPTPVIFYFETIKVQ